MKKLTGWLCMAILATVVLAGCGSGSTNDAATQAPGGADGAKKGGVDSQKAPE